MATEAIRAPGAGPAPMHEFSRLVGVFLEPKKTFGDIAERPRWLAPLLLVIVSSFSLIYLFNIHVGWEPYLHRIMDNNPRMQQLAPDVRQQVFDRQLRFIPIFSYVGGVLFAPILFLIGGGIILGIVKGLLGVPMRFAQVFAVMAYAWLPRVIYAGLSIIVMFLKNPDDFDIQNSFASNPGAFMDPDTSSKFLYSLASAVDLFSIWVMLLIATGLKAAGGKRISFGGALFAVVLPWAVYTLGRAGLAALGLGG
ncbi:MAG TPA: YIP1 family protein [Bryobacteraceae bacterium]|nr:YIP1 family protein [Bryobacteraceae bacterium]